MGEDGGEGGVGEAGGVGADASELERLERRAQLRQNVHHGSVVRGERRARAAEDFQLKRHAIPHDVSPIPEVRASGDVELFDGLYRAVQHAHQDAVVHVGVPVSMSHARRLHGHRHLEDAKVTPTRVLEVIVRASDDAPSGFAAHVVEPEFAQMRARALQLEERKAHVFSAIRQIEHAETGTLFDGVE